PDTEGGVEAVGGLVEEDLEHFRGREVECLAGQEHFASRVAVGEPPSAPPVAELDETAPFDAGPEDDDGVGNSGVAALDLVPGRLAGGDEGAGSGGVLFRDVEAVALDPPGDLGGGKSEPVGRQAGDDVAGEPFDLPAGRGTAELLGEEYLGEPRPSGRCRPPREVGPAPLDRCCCQVGE